ncbi:tryptophan ABC transporter substrate-binding protein [Amygdalobacter nucleatus]|uniref:ABC transporter substrate binding protein n=1 Tax=Amygdalobacter nucleatus TaxID=3029274 RepID=A0A133YCH5_9FIRM|nr:tryptophan ABC transporter substrate-binding protein [Amygdalobacter nucleatus]KXB40903.1 ABC transporter substrate binding protein [Amygdalobacter nucleatus]MDF0485389.1 tryptophan ABC transporter substrate-binding protein [Amygdalobacter nucleatus]
MKKKSSFAFIVLVVLALIVSLFFLKKLDNGNSEKVSSVSAKNEVPTIGILQLVSHPALDSIKQGIIDGLADAGYQEGKSINIDFQNAQGDQSNLSLMAQQLLTKEKKLVIGITTPAAQQLASKEKERPIILSGITYPKQAGLVDSEEHPGKNVTGVSDRLNIKAQIEQIHEVLPDAKKIGILYTSSEDNALAQAKTAEQEIKKIGLETVVKSVTNTTDIHQVATQLASEVQAIYVPIDNGIASAMATLVQVTDQAKIPVFPSADSMVKDGGMMGIGVDQYQIGRLTAKVVVDVLNGKDVATYPIQVLDKGTTYINKKKAVELNINIPEKIAEKAVAIDK